MLFFFFHSMAYRENPEYKTIKQCKPQLAKRLALDLPVISDELFSRDFIPSQVCKKMKMTGGEDYKAASEMLDNISHQIELDPTKFDTFIGILRSERSREGLVEFLESTLKDIRADFQEIKSDSGDSSFSGDVTSMYVNICVRVIHIFILRFRRF